MVRRPREPRTISILPRNTGSAGFWWKAAVITAALLLPFGSVILIAVAAARARRARQAGQMYTEWWRMRDLSRTKASPSIINGRPVRENGTVLHPEFANNHRTDPQ